MRPWAIFGLAQLFIGSVAGFVWSVANATKVVRRIEIEEPSRKRTGAMGGGLSILAFGCLLVGVWTSQHGLPLIPLVGSAAAIGLWFTGGLLALFAPLGGFTKVTGYHPDD